MAVRGAVVALVAVVIAGPRPALAQSSASSANDAPATAGGPIRLRQPQLPVVPSAPPAERAAAAAAAAAAEETLPRYVPGEFETYLQRLLGDKNMRRFGADLLIDSPPDRQAPQEAEPPVPPDYKVSSGDELTVAFWGAVDADLRLTVDRAGRINIPRVGSVQVAGLPLAEIGPAIDKQARKVFKNYELSVSLGQLRHVRVFVTGFALRPGAYTVSSLATLSSVLFTRAGGPSASGSFRDIELRRGGRTVAHLDLYDLMLFGRRDADQSVQADDVIHVGPVGRQVGLIGSVNKAAIFELRQAETVADVVRMGGGFNAVADRSRVALERLSERNDRRVRQLALPEEANAVLDAGDVVRAFSAIDAVLPQERNYKRVRVEGEVLHPGTFILPPDTTLTDAIQAAGGLTKSAYIFGTEFIRESVRQTQQVNYERALRDVELEISKRATTTTARTAEEATAQTAQQIASERLLSRLREARPTGRIVLQLAPDAKELPSLALEEGDRLVIPAAPTAVGVFGSVFNAGSYIYSRQSKVEDYLRLAGNSTRSADRESIFVVRANGSVVSAQQDKGSWFGIGASRIEDVPALAGDTVFVPEEANKTTFLQAAKDWTQVLYQLGLGLASIKLIVP